VRKAGIADLEHDAEKTLHLLAARPLAARIVGERSRRVPLTSFIVK
jgi:hypothetical protein